MSASLILISFIALFLELAFIRWLPANVLSLAYFSNIVLISAFLGLGLGFLLAPKKPDFFKYFPLALLGMVGIFWLFRNIETIIPPSSAEFIWSFYYYNSWLELPKIKLGIIPTLLAVFSINALFFAIIGQKMARLMAKFSPLQAYSLNIFGSLLGIIVFSLLALRGGDFSSPLVWFIGVGLLSLWFLRENKRYLLLGGLCLIAIGPILYSNYDFETWSPYYSLQVKKAAGGKEGEGFSVYVNRFYHQMAMDFKDKDNQYARGQYAQPYLLKKPRKVLILGAGTGNDAAIAGMQGVPDITAVEIDPAIAQLGQKLHPAQPYQNPNVKLVINDARNWLETNQETYDMIILGTLDSHAIQSGLSTIRLENFVYTVEALQAVKKHLASDGVAVLMFSVPEQWLGDKLIKTTLAVFSDPAPLVYAGDPKFLFSLMIVAGPGVTDILKNHPKGVWPFQQVSENSFAAKNLPTDNWPYLYLKEHTIPIIYLKAIILFIVLSLLGILALAPKNRREWVGWPGLKFFSLGAAFLLLETKSIVTLSLLFGSTWLVNSFVFASIMIMILLANWLVGRTNIKRLEIVYIFLGLALALNYFWPVSYWLGASFWVRSLGPTLLVALPLFFAAIIFSHNLKAVKNLSLMFGLNLLGAVLGGFLEYSSMLTGFNFLYILAGALYFIAFAASKKQQPQYANTPPLA